MMVMSCSNIRTVGCSASTCTLGPPEGSADLRFRYTGMSAHAREA